MHLQSKVSWQDFPLKFIQVLVLCSAPHKCTENSKNSILESLGQKPEFDFLKKK